MMDICSVLQLCSLLCSEMLVYGFAYIITGLQCGFEENKVCIYCVHAGARMHLWIRTYMHVCEGGG